MTNANIGKHHKKTALNFNRSRRVRRLTVGVSVALIGATGAGLAGAQMTASSGTSTDILAKIAFCESTDNPKAQNSSSTASGLFQDLTTTWQSLPGTAGYANAKDAPVSVQVAANEYMYQHDGTSPWLASKPCWSKLSSAPALAGLSSGTTTTTAAATTTTTKQSAGSPITSPVPTSSVTSVRTAADGTLLSNGIAHFPYAKIKLTEAEQKELKSLTDAQKTQSWWTPQAAAGQTVTRTVSSTSSMPVFTHSYAQFTSAQKDVLKNQAKITGHYINTDWFEITSGANKGQFVSTATLTRIDDEKNGKLSANQLAQVPNELRSVIDSENASLNPTALKQLIYMNAAFRMNFAANMKINEGYRTFAVQESYFEHLPKGRAATPGTSNHGLGDAIDLAGNGFKDGNAVSSWMKSYAAGFGFQNTANVADKGEFWHYDFAG